MIQAEIRSVAAADAPIRALLLDDSDAEITDGEHDRVQEAVKKRYNPRANAADPSLKITHLKHMSLKQMCPYMEFLLRWMDAHHVGGKRWFLSVVDAARAGAKMA